MGWQRPPGERGAASLSRLAGAAWARAIRRWLLLGCCSSADPSKLVVLVLVLELP